MALRAMHFKFAITKSSTIGAVAAAVANGDLAVAAFIMLWYDICNHNTVLHKFIQHVCGMEGDSHRGPAHDGDKNKRVWYKQGRACGRFLTFCTFMQ